MRLVREEDIPCVLELNRQFADSKICNGIVADTPQDLKAETVFVAENNGKICAYAYGHFEDANCNTDLLKKGDKTFMLEEIYVVPKMRSVGLGKALFEFVENFAKEGGAKTVQVYAVSKDYARLLKFYIDTLGFDFWSAWLIKKI